MRKSVFEGKGVECWRNILIRLIIIEMRKLTLGILLILMMFGHNYVLNQTQTMQKSL